MSPEKTIRMANQIATFFQSQGGEEAVTGVAEHINSFWEPRMRAQLFELIESGEKSFHPAIYSAVPLIRRPKAAAVA
ncbi:MAG TPA: formate dehydrogenase subunit delta [Rhizobiaceae bacterium]|nr:formate dehydrogenase subunit delta [Rhizobiaceae bacterium]